MAFSLERFIELRPYLYHSTSKSNLELLRDRRKLVAASTLLGRCGMRESVGVKRVGKTTLPSGHILQSQKPLIGKNIGFEDGWSLTQLLAQLNGLIFFWPGTGGGPIKNGVNHFKSKDGPIDAKGIIVLRIPTQDAFFKRYPFFCKYNSGSPRCSGGRPSPRGPKTFVSKENFEGTVSGVVEVVFRDELRLPVATEYASAFGGPWSLLHGVASNVVETKR